MTRPLVCAALIFSAVAAAQDAGSPAKPTPKADAGSAAKSPGTIADAGVAAAKQPRPAFAIARSSLILERWAKAKPEARGALQTLKAVKIGERVYLGLFLENWELPFSRKVDLTGDLTITDCNKRLVLEKAGIATAKTTDPKVNIAVPLTPTIELMYGLTDPDCTYSVRAIIYDNVRGQSWASDGTFVVTR